MASFSRHKTGTAPPVWLVRFSPGHFLLRFIIHSYLARFNCSCMTTRNIFTKYCTQKALCMHGHYLLKLTASLARVRKMPLYFIIFVRKFCTLLMCDIYLHMATKFCPFVIEGSATWL